MLAGGSIVSNQLFRALGFEWYAPLIHVIMQVCNLESDMMRLGLTIFAVLLCQSWHRLLLSNFFVITMARHYGHDVYFGYRVTIIISIVCYAIELMEKSALIDSMAGEDMDHVKVIRFNQQVNEQNTSRDNSPEDVTFSAPRK